VAAAHARTARTTAAAVLGAWRVRVAAVAAPRRQELSGLEKAATEAAAAAAEAAAAQVVALQAAAAPSPPLMPPPHK